MTRIEEIEQEIKRIDDERARLAEQRTELVRERAHRGFAASRFTVGSRWSLKRGKRQQEVEVLAPVPSSWSDGFDLLLVTHKKDGTRGAEFRLSRYDFKDLTPLAKDASENGGEPA